MVKNKSLTIMISKRISETFLTPTLAIVSDLFPPSPRSLWAGGSKMKDPGNEVVETTRTTVACGQTTAGRAKKEPGWESSGPSSLFFHLSSSILFAGSSTTEPVHKLNYRCALDSEHDWRLREVDGNRLHQEMTSSSNWIEAILWPWIFRLTSILLSSSGKGIRRPYVSICLEEQE